MEMALARLEMEMSKNQLNLEKKKYELNTSLVEGEKEIEE